MICCWMLSVLVETYPHHRSNYSITSSIGRVAACRGALTAKASTTATGSGTDSTSVWKPKERKLEKKNERKPSLLCTLKFYANSSLICWFVFVSWFANVFSTADSWGKLCNFKDGYGHSEMVGPSNVSNIFIPVSRQVHST